MHPSNDQIAALFVLTFTPDYLLHFHTSTLPPVPPSLPQNRSSLVSSHSQSQSTLTAKQQLYPSLSVRMPSLGGFSPYRLNPIPILTPKSHLIPDRETPRQKQ